MTLGLFLMFSASLRVYHDFPEAFPVAVVRFHAQNPCETLLIGGPGSRKGMERVVPLCMDGFLICFEGLRWNSHT